jgi:hypothetical protein
METGNELKRNFAALCKQKNCMKNRIDGASNKLQ